MFNKNKFKYFVAEKDKTLGEVSDYLGINPATLTRKMNGESDFTRSEIQAISLYLGLSVTEVVDIFFS